MLNRRILRIKAFKVLYSLAENPQMTFKEAEAQMKLSVESTRTLYIFLLGIVGPLTAEAKSRIEASKAKFNPTEDELHPNFKFVGNKIATSLDGDPDFQKALAKSKLSWEQYDMLLRHLYESIREKQYFKDYLDSGKDSIKEDADLWVKIFEEEFVDNAEMADILEDLSIWWNDDLAYSLTWCCKAIDDIAAGKPWRLPELYMSDITGSKDSDRDFSIGIIRRGVAKFTEYYDAVASLTPKWDKNRICSTDLALIVAGLAEHDAFPDIPTKVIINEYVEISKFYSTPESRGFVNGLLDKLINKQ